MPAKPDSGLFRIALVREFWRRERKRAVGLAAITVAAVIGTVVFPRILGYVVDSIQTGLTDPAHFAPRALVNYALILLGLGLARSVITNLRYYFAGQGSEFFLWQTRNGVFRRMLVQGFTFTNRFPTGDVMVRLDEDMDMLSWYACFVMLQLLEAVVTLVLALVILIRMNPLLTLVTIAPVSTTVFMWLRIGPRLFKWYREWREKISATSNALESSYSGIRLVKSYTMEERSRKSLRRVLNERIAAALRTTRLDALVGGFYTSIAEIGVLLVLSVGGMAVIKQTMSLGDFVAFNAYVILLINPMFQIGHFFVMGRQGQAAEVRIRELRDFPPDVVAAGSRAPGASDAVRMNRVGYCYAPVQSLAAEPGPVPAEKASAPPVRALENISLELTPGARIGIAGTVGSGKSTVMRLLLRIAEASEGDISIGGVPLKDFEICSLRDRFGYAPQEACLISDSIYNNITLGREVRPFRNAECGVRNDRVEAKLGAEQEPPASGETAARVAEVARIAQLDADLQKMPKGLDETIGERGLKLSGGQQGRVSIARALFGRPHILLLDDVTASLDAETEQQFIHDVTGYLPDATLVIISHRLSILAACDRVYVLDQGRMVESGTHHELLAAHGTYWKLYERQLMKEALEGRA